MLVGVVCVQVCCLFTWHVCVSACVGVGESRSPRLVSGSFLLTH